MNETNEFYKAVTKAYDFFNERFFEKTLPGCIIVTSREGRSFGHFVRDGWRKNSNSGGRLDEISVNPEYLISNPLSKTGSVDESIMLAFSTLLHEMVHLWQMHFGERPPKGVYHNKEWAQKMHQVGLHPSSTGRKGGKETGTNCSHYIIEKGAYEVAWNDLINSGWNLNWLAIPHNVFDSGLLEELKKKGYAITESDEEQIKKRAKRKKQQRKCKTKYSCGCGTNIWAKPDLIVICGECGNAFVMQG